MSPQIHILTRHPEFRDLLVSATQGFDVEVVDVPNTVMGLTFIEATAVADQPIALVSDLTVPRSNGKGMLGGLELANKAHERGVSDTLFLFFAQPHPEAAYWAKKWTVGGTLPSVSELQKSPEFFRPLLSRFTPVAPSAPEAADQTSSHAFSHETDVETTETVTLFGQHIHTEDVEWDGTFQIADDVSMESDANSPSLTGLERFRALLCELNDPQYEEEINLLLLRYASVVFHRGALFLFRKEKSILNGFGAFGTVDESVSGRIKRLEIPLEDDHVFQACLRERRSLVIPYLDNEWGSKLTAAMGSSAPETIYTAPFFSPRGLEGVLYAEKGTQEADAQALTLFEIFLQQAGAALERNSLSKQLQELKRQFNHQPH